MSAFRQPGGAGRAIQDVLGGLVLVVIAFLALYLVNHLPATGKVGFASGTAPRLFAYGLGILGAGIAVVGWLNEGPGLGQFSIRGTITILGSVLLFALMIRTFGLLATGIPMVILASFAAKDFHLGESILFAIGITLFCAIIFPYALGQPIPLWPAF